MSPCRGDHFHLVRDFEAVVSYLENRAYAAVDTCQQREHEQGTSTTTGQIPTQCRTAAFVTLASGVRSGHQAVRRRFLVAGLALPGHPEVAGPRPHTEQLPCCTTSWRPNCAPGPFVSASA